MDKELLFYLIFGLIYLLSRIGKKKKGQKPVPPQQQQPQKRPSPSQPQSSNPTTDERQEDEIPMSFEDILRELSGEGRKKQQDSPAPQAVEPQKKPLVSDPQPQAPPSSPSPPSPYESYQGTEAADLWTAYKREDKTEQGRPSGPSPKTKVSKRAKKFDVYEVQSTENPLASEIRDMLSDKDDVKKAVILSEILNRRY